MEFPGWDILAAWRRPGENFPIGGITWLEIAGVFLHRPDSPGWSFVDGSSLQFSFPEFLSWNLTKLLASLFLERNFIGGVSWVGHPGWQFFPFVLGTKS